ncbi:uncharacterized protein LOC111703869 [Eurytemora carolleeae]|uniref:uncharacterized protein LOC111703869 n=1 Tax=Eurytemora carolleeae TaxID=1294199 RepID=UPI000C75B10B|nr:uncharacterized protein LOC111703869 [Eurytemora carolleeae]|eukprot:XP_023331713.1 uncharacterized protein LOC111703869 [Eurytemora affinis]
MAPYYTRSKEVWYNGDGVIVSKHEIDHEVYWDMDRVMIGVLYTMGLVLLLWCITFTIQGIIYWRVGRVLSAKGKDLLEGLTGKTSLKLENLDESTKSGCDDQNL